MRKLLVILGSVGLTATISSNVVSCIAPQYATGLEGQRVIVVTDGGQINDHSFDQGAYEGMLNYLNTTYNTKTDDEKLKVDGTRNYIVPVDSTTTSLVSSYRLAKLKKADALVLPGFVHMGPIDQTTSLFKDKTVVMLDGAPEDINAPQNKNVIGILFNSQIAGMQAGFDTAYWATQRDENGKLYGSTANKNFITIGTFGGVSGKYAVDNYMWGLFLGIALFNEYFGKERGEIRIANAPENKLENVRVLNNADQGYYSGNFSLGGATKSGIIAKLVNDNNADIIFPIAGSQIQDVFSYQPYNRQRPYVIGVDVDQAAVYPEQQGRFITSAVKNINDATVQALQHASSLKDIKDGKLVERNSKDNSQVWDGSLPSPYLNWSTDITGKNYKLQKQKLFLYDGDGAQKVNEDNHLIKMVNDFYTKAGTTPQEYMNGQKIIAFAKQIVSVFKEKNWKLVNDGEEHEMIGDK